MRYILSLMLLLAACSPAQEDQPVVPKSAAAGQSGTWTGAGRDRMCLAKAGEDWRVGIVAYGDGDNNCTFRGKVVMAEHGILVEALGDPACSFFIESVGGPDATVSRLPKQMRAACAYYCGPTASLAGKEFRPNQNASPAVDLASDPLC